MAKRVLITGGAGFIGSNLSLKLVSKGYSVSVLDNLSPQIHGSKQDSVLYNSIKDKITFFEGDVRDKARLKEALQDVNAIIHLAAETGTGQSMYEVGRYIDVNCTGTGVLLDLLINEKHSVEKVVLASSRAVYGEGKYKNGKGEIVFPDSRGDEQMKLKKFDPLDAAGNPLQALATDETSRINPLSIYAATKYNQEQYLNIGCASIGVPVVIFRYQNVYGPGQSLKNPYTGILSIFSTQIKNGKGINVFEDGNESRDFVFIDDVVEATILGLEKPGANNQVFNVGSGVATSVLAVANSLAAAYKLPVDVSITGNYRIGDIRHNYADLTKIKSALGFAPKVNFETGLGLFAAWVNQQQIETDNYQKSIAEMASKGLIK